MEPINTVIVEIKEHIFIVAMTMHVETHLNNKEKAIRIVEQGLEERELLLANQLRKLDIDRDAFALEKTNLGRGMKCIFDPIRSHGP